jgi:hypothetical protein
VAAFTSRRDTDDAVEFAACPSRIPRLVASVATSTGITDVIGDLTVGRRIATRVAGVTFASPRSLTRMTPLGGRVPSRGFYAMAREASGAKCCVEYRCARHRPASAGDVTSGIGTAAGQSGVIDSPAVPWSAR